MGRAEDLFSEAKAKGESFISHLIETKQSEDLFIDFKRSSNAGAGADLSPEDRKNLARAVSGFANSAGGIIIWGVDCKKDAERGDIPGPAYPIENPARFASWLEGKTSGCTLPAHTGVHHHPITSKAHANKGFVVSLIPASALAPHSTVVRGESSDFYMRAGSNFERVPHAVLAGMFGRRPTPLLTHSLKATDSGKYRRGLLVLSQDQPEPEAYMEIAVVLSNQGPVSARELYLNVDFELPHDRWMVIHGLTAKYWQSREAPIGSGYHFVSDDSFRLAPLAQVEVCRFVLFISQVVNAYNQFAFDMSYGCDGSSIARITIEHSSLLVGSRLNDFLHRSCSPESAQNFVDRVFRPTASS